MAFDIAPCLKIVHSENTSEMLFNRLAPLGVAVLVLAGCASDEAPEDQITPDSVVGDGIDTDVDDGVDTEVEVSENLGFDEPDEG